MKTAKNFSTDRILIAFLMIAMLVLTGCGPVVVDETRTPKEKAQDALLTELEGCSTKFGGNDYTDKRMPNIAYCNQIVVLLEGLIRDGYFEGEEFDNALLQAKNFTSTEAEVDKSIDLESLTEDILGEI